MAMRWAILAACLVACDPGTGVVYDGDTDIVLTAQQIGGKCESTRQVEIAWAPPEGTTEFVLSWCVSDNGAPGFDPTPECWTAEEEQAHVGEDGFVHWSCSAHSPAYTWQIDFVAPAP